MLGRSLTVSCGMLALEPEEFSTIFRNMLLISLKLVGSSVVDSRNLLRSKANRLSLLIYKLVPGP